MIPLLSIFLSLNLALVDAPKNNSVSLKTYISENAKVYCRVYWINEDIPDEIIPNIEEKKIIEKSEQDFFKTLKKYMIEYHLVGSYYFFNRIQK